MTGTANVNCSSNLDSAAFHINATGSLVANGSRSVATPILKAGTVTAASGTLTMQSGLAATQQTGQWQIADAATLYFNGSSYHLTGGQITANGVGRTGALRTDADLALDNTVPLDVENLSVEAGTLTLSGAGPATTPNTVTFTNGTRAGSRDWTIQTLNVQTANFVGSSTTTVSGTTTKSTGGTWLVRSGPHLIFNGAVAHGDGQLCVDDASNTTDPLVEVNAAWTMTGTANLNCSSNLDSAAFHINATGSLGEMGSGTKTIGTPVLNAGTVSI